MDEEHIGMELFYSSFFCIKHFFWEDDIVTLIFSYLLTSDL